MESWVQIQVPDDHVILVSFQWLHIEVPCVYDAVDLFIGGDHVIEKRKKYNCLHCFPTGSFADISSCKLHSYTKLPLSTR